MLPICNFYVAFLKDLWYDKARGVRSPLKSKHDRQVIPMYLKQLAAFGMSAVMVLSGGVVASGAETKTTVDTVTPQE